MKIRTRITEVYTGRRGERVGGVHPYSLAKAKKWPDKLHGVYAVAVAYGYDPEAIYRAIKAGKLPKANAIGATKTMAGVRPNEVKEVLGRPTGWKPAEPVDREGEKSTGKVTAARPGMGGMAIQGKAADGSEFRGRGKDLKAGDQVDLVWRSGAWRL